MPRPLCFVLMPFGRKPSGTGGTIDFDAIYADLIKPAIEAAEMEPIRADEEYVGGVIHKPMFERLILCDYAVADLTAANANVFYELGVRHAVRPYSTVLTFAEGIGQLPFDVAPLRALPYRLDASGRPAGADAGRKALTEQLKQAHAGAVDSPLYQLVNDYPNIDHTKTDVFRDQVDYSARMKTKLMAARKSGIDGVRAVEQEIGRLDNAESGVIVDLFLSYRAVSAWKEMIRLAELMPRPLAATVMVQEQLALALNRNGQGDEAEEVLHGLIEKRGPSSETYGILGRVHKDRWEAALKAGKALLARGLLDKAIEAYLRGFEADWRDAYPGVNAITLMELRDPPDPRRIGLRPVVRYATERRIAAGAPDYWDFATLLEIAVLNADQASVAEQLAKALAAMREDWEAETTMRNLRLIREARQRRGEPVDWIAEIEQSLGDRRRELTAARPPAV
jgi:tetratricopeptide (TPR) repeat protein